MSTTETLLYLVGVPAAVVAVIWALVYRGGPAAQKRYRPGRPYTFAPVWYVANHEADQGGPPALETERRRAALPAPDTDQDAMRPSVGGASERW
ncbi:MAG: hypothetical protein FWJ70_13270 [Micromonosporaceae bacterium]